MKIIFIIFFVGISALVVFKTNSSNFINNQVVSNNDGAEKIQHAFQNKLSNVQVQSSGKVEVVLADDNKGSRHQRFILKLSTGQTVLIAHNIDLAPRIPKLEKGDVVEFFGEYEWNEKGGVIHWTHKDPNKKHVDGWLKFRGEIYW